jgi:pSer/pThr/pTyr-binding forkhead associated (FHA) protein
VGGDDEPFEVSDNVTVGRHIDNDFVIAGEDVRDYHARITVTPRGLRVVPLEEAPLLVGEVPVASVHGLAPGDVITIGQHEIRVEVIDARAAGSWKLCAGGDAAGVSVHEALAVGRGEDNDLRINDGHISRHHARLEVVDDVVWIRDLGSSNGTFVNGERLVGAWRLFHGDEVTFDERRYQLIGDNPELTPVRPLAEIEESRADTLAPLEPAPAATAEVSRVDVASTQLAETGTSTEDGPSLVGVAAPILHQVFPLSFGRYLIGRAPEADVFLAEPSVSLKHAELELDADGARVTNLISTNGTQVNGEDIHIRRLEHGDQLQVGRVVLEYRHPHPPEAQSPSERSTAVVAVTALVVGVTLGVVLWLAFS